MKQFSRSSNAIVFVSAALVCCLIALFTVTRTLSYAQPTVTQPSLGSAGAFAVLGGSTVTNTGPTVVNGDLGVSPGSAVTGFPPGVVHGTMHKADGVALQAQNDITTAYNVLAGESCSHNLTGQDLGGKTLVPGVYCFSSSAQLTGALTLNGNGLYVFQIGSTLTTGSNASVKLEGGAGACNVFWQVGSSATLGTHTSFVGNILALTSITLNTGAISDGGLYARHGAVTLDTNTVSRASCGSGEKTPTPRPKVLPTATPSRFPGMPNTGSDPTRRYP